jgi:hypothetical protein
MPLGTALGSGSTGEAIIHFNAIRLRVVGTGQLRPTMISLQGVESQVLVPLTMSTTTDIQPTRLCNFIKQRAQLELKTTSLDEIFKINRIIVFAKPIFSDYPG